jgi:3-oxosteroid 1-dehydrogenase
MPTHFDVIVLGTGASGLTAALTAAGHGASVGLFEKGHQVGGTSAKSGGMIWIPGNHLMEPLGLTDSREEALTYINSLSHGMILDELAEAFVDGGPGMLRWLEDNTPVRFEIVERFPDYHPENPGGKTGGGRSMECPLFAYGELGEWAGRVLQGHQMGKHTVMNETTLGKGTTDHIDPIELTRRTDGDLRGCGQALVGRLLKGCLDRGVVPQTDHRAVRLIVEDGRVTGVEFEIDAANGTTETKHAYASGGVVLATGGFDWDPALVRSFLRGPMQRTVAVETNTGDGLKMAMRIGAALGNMREAWWVPIMDVADEGQAPKSWLVNRERTRPHSIMVNKQGERFTNEAVNYNAFGSAFHEMNTTTFEYVNLPAWLVFDQTYATTYGLAGRFRGEGAVPSWIIRADTVSGLAEKLGISVDGFTDTIQRWNAISADGDDPDFGRGRSVNDRWWGDAKKLGAETTLGPIDNGPFYAVQVRPGALGTKGGPRTTADGQVIDVDEQPIQGLYAAGNVMASAMGMTYGGGGGTLAPGMVFGFLAGRHAAQHSPERSVVPS